MYFDITVLKNIKQQDAPWQVLTQYSSSILPKHYAASQPYCLPLLQPFLRSEKAEYMAQNIIAISLILCAIVLWWLALSGGSLWGSNYLPKPLSLVCVIIAFSAKMNIKGTNISFGANPHSIGKKKSSSNYFATRLVVTIRC